MNDNASNTHHDTRAKVQSRTQDCTEVLWILYHVQRQHNLVLGLDT